MTETDLNRGNTEPTVPRHMLALPRLDGGMPVPKFATETTRDGDKSRRFDLTVMNMQHFNRCMTGRRCWICGNPLGRIAMFTGGPKSAFSRNYSEPPSHPSCAAFAMQSCPYLTGRSTVRRNEPSAETIAATHGDPAHPGTFALSAASRWWFDEAGRSVVAQDTHMIVFWKEGRHATEAEIDSAIRKMHRETTEEMGLSEKQWQQGMQRMRPLIAFRHPPY